MTPRDISVQASHLIQAAEVAVKNNAALDRAGLEQIDLLLRLAKQVVPNNPLLQATNLPDTSQFLFNWSGVLAIAHTIQSAAQTAV